MAVIGKYPARVLHRKGPHSSDVNTMNFRPSYRIIAVSVFVIGIIPGFACSRNESRKESPVSKQDPILMERAAKDEAFRSGTNSPIPENDRSSFQGLDYYPINLDLRFSLKLNRYSRPGKIRLATNTGEIRSGLLYGYFEFMVENQTCRLQVYRLEDVTENGGPSLFIPFRDATSGKETYGSCRYIDLKENISGIYELDFNRAYNPYCAFNNQYSCPLPPPENVLSVPIRAGEKKYKGNSNAH
jgi:uncharacterized protein (DUF1684 family)